MSLFHGWVQGNKGPLDRWLEITRDGSGQITIMILSASKVSLGAMRMPGLEAHRAAARLSGGAAIDGPLANDLRTILPRVMLRNITPTEQAALKRRWAPAKED